MSRAACCRNDGGPQNIETRQPRDAERTVEAVVRPEHKVVGILMVGGTGGIQVGW
jgi:hypothetical protein